MGRFLLIIPNDRAVRPQPVLNKITSAVAVNIEKCATVEIRIFLKGVFLIMPDIIDVICEIWKKFVQGEKPSDGNDNDYSCSGQYDFQPTSVWKNYGSNLINYCHYRPTTFLGDNLWKIILC